MEILHACKLVLGAFMTILGLAAFICALLSEGQRRREYLLWAILLFTIAR